MITIIIHGLPNCGHLKLNQIKKYLKKGISNEKEFYILEEKINILMPMEMVKDEIGEVITILVLNADLTKESRYNLARAIRNTMHIYFPNAFIDITIPGNNPDNVRFTGHDSF